MTPPSEDIILNIVIHKQLKLHRERSPVISYRTLNIRSVCWHNSPARYNSTYREDAVPKPRLSLEVQDVGDSLACQSNQVDFGKIRQELRFLMGHFTQTVNHPVSASDSQLRNVVTETAN